MVDIVSFSIITKSTGYNLSTTVKYLFKGISLFGYHYLNCWMDSSSWKTRSSATTSMDDIRSLSETNSHRIRISSPTGDSIKYRRIVSMKKSNSENPKTKSPSFPTLISNRISHPKTQRPVPLTDSANRPLHPK